MTTLAKWIRRATSLLTQSHKVVLKADDWSLEHVLVYHGLVGTSPEGSRAFKDVRADFISAVNRGNSHNLCICLKLPPLQWEDKLQKIAAEFEGKEKEALIKTLLPDASDVYEQSTWDPLSYLDWHVQANAAMLLAYLGATQAQDRLIAALDSTAGGINPAFCHITRALAHMPTHQSREALTRYSTSAEPWLRVDAVSALASWPIDQIGQTLQKSFSEHHKFFDYQAVAVAKKHSPADFIEIGTQESVDLACEIITGTIEAMQSTFANQSIIEDFELLHCLKLLGQRKNTEFSPVELFAIHSLLQWAQNLTDDESAEAHLPEARARLGDEQIASKLTNYLQTIKTDASQKQTLASAHRYAIKLAGQLQISTATSALMALLESYPQATGELAESLGELKAIEAVSPLIKMAQSLVDVEERTSSTPSAQPIDEEDRISADIYWHILHALGKMPTQEALDFVLKATNDSAPDKREAALTAATSIYLADGGKLAKSEEVIGALVKALNDPSMQVKQTAMEASGTIKKAELVEPLAKLTQAGETAISRKAFDALRAIHNLGLKAEVESALAVILTAERNGNKSKKIKDFADSLKS